jgi:hypothetical protein
MADYSAMTEGMLQWARRWNPPDKIPARIDIGSTAWPVLRDVIAGQRRPALPGDPDFIDRTVLSCAGLPIRLRTDWPPNMYALIDSGGRAIVAGVLNERDEVDE